MFKTVSHLVVMMLLLTGLTACFSASVHIQFDEAEQVKIENAVILEKELVLSAKPRRDREKERMSQTL